MAIQFDNKYCKIARSVNDYINNTTEIQMEVYKSMETRNHEKNCIEDARQFCGKVQSYLYETATKLIAELGEIKPFKSVEERDEYLQDKPELKKKIEKQEKIQEEGLILINKILHEDIDPETLKYKKIWQALGLTDELCQKVDYVGTMSIGVDGVRESKIEGLYGAVKEKIVSDVTDC